MSGDVLPILILILIGGLVVAGIVWGAIAARKRREALFEIAAGLGLEFSPGNDRTLAGGYGFLNKLAQGANRFAFNVISGVLRGERVLVFDYHYETHSTNAKGQRQTHHHYFSVFILTLPRLFPELTITREGIFSKLAQAIGYDDIDFESHEFSRKFCVRSRDKRFAYDICHARMMEYLLANEDLNIEIERHAVALLFNRRLKPEQIRPNLERLMTIRALIPAYLLTPV